MTETQSEFLAARAQSIGLAISLLGEDAAAVSGKDAKLEAWLWGEMAVKHAILLLGGENPVGRGYGQVPVHGVSK